MRRLSSRKQSKLRKMAIEEDNHLEIGTDYAKWSTDCSDCMLENGTPDSFMVCKGMRHAIWSLSLCTSPGMEQGLIRRESKCRLTVSQC